MLGAIGTARGLGALGAAVLLAAGCGSPGNGGTDATTTGAEHTTIGHLHTSVVPAGMVDPLRFGYPPSDSVMYPVVNAWAVADHRSEVDVYAGAASPVQGRAHRGDGLLVINRYGFLPLRQTQKHVLVPDAGPLRITQAPHGRAVVTSAQHHGVIRFEGRSGARGTLRLATDKVTLQRPG